MARVETREIVAILTKSRPAPEVSKGTIVPQSEAKARTPGARAFLPVNNKNAAKVLAVRFQLTNHRASVPSLLQQSEMPTLPCLSKIIFTDNKNTYTITYLRSSDTQLPLLIGPKSLSRFDINNLCFCVW